MSRPIRTDLLSRPDPLQLPETAGLERVSGPRRRHHYLRRFAGFWIAFAGLWVLRELERHLASHGA